MLKDKKKALIISSKDNVGVALKKLKRGEEIFSIKLIQKIPTFHKFALKDIKRGEKIIKYGYSIGVASKNIKKGELISIHNLESERGRGDKKT
jgi:altronate dehydratase small subunit